MFVEINLLDLLHTAICILGLRHGVLNHLWILVLTGLILMDLWLSLHSSLRSHVGVSSTIEHRISGRCTKVGLWISWLSLHFIFNYDEVLKAVNLKLYYILIF